MKSGPIASSQGRSPNANEFLVTPLPRREEFSPLGAFWHTEVGPLNEIIHVWAV